MEFLSWGQGLYPGGVSVRGPLSTGASVQGWGLGLGGASVQWVGSLSRGPLSEHMVSVQGVGSQSEGVYPGGSLGALV